MHCFSARKTACFKQNKIPAYRKLANQGSYNLTPSFLHAGRWVAGGKHRFTITVKNEDNSPSDFHMEKNLHLELQLGIVRASVVSWIERQPRI